MRNILTGLACLSSPPKVKHSSPVDPICRRWPERLASAPVYESELIFPNLVEVGLASAVALRTSRPISRLDEAAGAPLPSPHGAIERRRNKPSHSGRQERILSTFRLSLRIWSV